MIKQRNRDKISTSYLSLDIQACSQVWRKIFSQRNKDEGKEKRSKKKKLREKGQRVLKRQDIRVVHCLSIK